MDGGKIERRRRERVVLPLEEGPDMPRRRGGGRLVWLFETVVESFG